VRCVSYQHLADTCVHAYVQVRDCIALHTGEMLHELRVIC